MLQLCCHQGLVQAVPLLLKAGCYPSLTSSIDCTPPFLIAAMNGNNQILRILCNEEDLVINGVKGDYTALHFIVRQLPKVPPKVKKGTIQCLKILLEIPRRPSEKIDVNAQDNTGSTALHYTVDTSQVAHYIL